MEDLFGVKMDWIMYVLLALLLPALAVIGFMALRNRVMLKMALRNIPRRKAQTALIVAGIMISTLIMAASFGTGDTLTFSIKKAVVDGLGTIDEFVLSARAGENDQFGGAAYVPMERFTALQQELADVDAIDGLAPGLAEIAPTVNERTSRSEGRMQIAGVNPDTLEGFGGFYLEGGGEARMEDLEKQEIFINSAASEELEAVPGDSLTVYVYGEPVSFTVKGVVSGGGPVGAEPTLLLHPGQGPGTLWPAGAHQFHSRLQQGRRIQRGGPERRSHEDPPRPVHRPRGCRAAEGDSFPPGRSGAIESEGATASPVGNGPG